MSHVTYELVMSHMTLLRLLCRLGMVCVSAVCCGSSVSAGGVGMCVCSVRCGGMYVFV